MKFHVMIAYGNKKYHREINAISIKDAFDWVALTCTHKLKIDPKNAKIAIAAKKHE